jgi:4-amino-4-deoxy-L-arabinose transferase-like glycosyltransferase
MPRVLSGTLAAARGVSSNRPDLVALLAIALVASAVRLAFFPSAPIFTHGDSQQYYEPARALLDGKGFDLGYKRAPLYSLVIAASTVLLGENLRRLVVLQHLLGVATALLTFGVGRLTFGWGVGLLSGLAAALSGGLLLYEHFLMSETLFAFLLTLTVFLYVAGLRRDSTALYLASGLAMALAALTRPHAQLLLVLAPAVGLLVARGWRPLLRATVVTSVVAGLLIVPWMARNEQVHGAFTVSGGSGAMLIENMANRNNGRYVFFFPDAPRNEPTRRHWRATQFIQQQADKKADQREDGEESIGITGRRLLTWMQGELGVDEVEADKIMRDVALNTIRAQPLTYARLLAQQSFQIFSGSSEQIAVTWERQREREWPTRLLRALPPITAEQERAQPIAELLVQLYQSARFGLLLPLLFVVGLFASAVRPEWRGALLPGLSVASFYLVSAAIVGFVPRYHYPPSPLLHVVGFGGLLFLVQWARSVLRARARERDRQIGPEGARSAAPAR